MPNIPSAITKVFVSSSLSNGGWLSLLSFTHAGGHERQQLRGQASIHPSYVLLAVHEIYRVVAGACVAIWPCNESFHPPPGSSISALFYPLLDQARECSKVFTENMHFPPITKHALVLLVSLIHDVMTLVGNDAFLMKYIRDHVQPAREVSSLPYEERSRWGRIAGASNSSPRQLFVIGVGAGNYDTWNRQTCQLFVLPDGCRQSLLAVHHPPRGSCLRQYPTWARHALGPRSKRHLSGVDVREEMETYVKLENVRTSE